MLLFTNTTGGKIISGVDDKTLAFIGMDEDNIFQTLDAITNSISDNCVPTIVTDSKLTKFRKSAAEANVRDADDVIADLRAKYGL